MVLFFSFDEFVEVVDGKDYLLFGVAEILGDV